MSADSEKTLTGKWGWAALDLQGSGSTSLSSFHRLRGPQAKGRHILRRVWNSLCGNLLSSMVLPGTWTGLALALNLAHRTFENRTLSFTVTRLDPQISTVPRWMITGRLGALPRLGSPWAKCDGTVSAGWNAHPLWKPAQCRIRLAITSARFCCL